MKRPLDINDNEPYTRNLKTALFANRSHDCPVEARLLQASCVPLRCLQVFDRRERLQGDEDLDLSLDADRLASAGSSPSYLSPMKRSWLNSTAESARAGIALFPGNNRIASIQAPSGISWANWRITGYLDREHVAKKGEAAPSRNRSSGDGFVCRKESLWNGI